MEVSHNNIRLQGKCVGEDNQPVYSDDGKSVVGYKRTFHMELDEPEPRSDEPKPTIVNDK